MLLVSSTREALARSQLAAELAFPHAERQAFLDPLLAVKQNQSWNADLVVCDFELRIIDGIQLIKLLRQQNRAVVSILLDRDEQHSRDADNLDILHLPEPEASTLKNIWEVEMRHGAEPRKTSHGKGRCANEHTDEIH